MTFHEAGRAIRLTRDLLATILRFVPLHTSEKYPRLMQTLCYYLVSACLRDEIL